MRVEYINGQHRITVYDDKTKLGSVVATCNSRGLLTWHGRAMKDRSFQESILHAIDRFNEGQIIATNKLTYNKTRMENMR